MIRPSPPPTKEKRHPRARPALRPSSTKKPSLVRSPVFRKVWLHLSANPDAQRLFDLLAETFKTLGDPSRVQVVWALSHGELCVGEIAELLKMSQSAVSHHLQRLRALKLVKVRRDHRTIYYSLDDKHIENLLDEGIEHVEDLLP